MKAMIANLISKRRLSIMEMMIELITIGTNTKSTKAHMI